MYSTSMTFSDATQVNKQYLIPVRAILLVASVAMLLGIVNIFSSTAFNAMTSFALLAQYTSFMIPISLMAVGRVGWKTVTYGLFQLGCWGATLLPSFNRVLAYPHYIHGLATESASYGREHELCGRCIRNRGLLGNYILDYLRKSEVYRTYQRGN